MRAASGPASQSANAVAALGAWPRAGIKSASISTSGAAGRPVALTVGSGATPKGTPGAISPTNQGPLMVRAARPSLNSCAATTPVDSGGRSSSAASASTNAAEAIAPSESSAGRPLSSRIRPPKPCSQGA